MAIRDGSATYAGVLAMAFLAVSFAARADTPDYKPLPAEALLTPKFCWKQFMGNKFSGSEFDIPHSLCGAFVNHYCPGLVDLNRANRIIGDEGKKRGYLASARVNTLYTLRGIKGFPNCPIRTHAETTLRVIDDELKAFR